MKMEGGIDANASLHYIEFQLFPSQNRYEASVCRGNRKEIVTSGPLAQLLRHSDKVKTLQSSGSNTNFKLEPPENLGNAKWFAKSTLLRFLHIIASPNILNSTNAIVNEISQLEEARRFHLSLYVKDPHLHLQSEEADSSNSDGASFTPKAKSDTASSDASKNELLRAMDLRLTALRRELAAALNKAAGAACSPDEIIDLEKFSHYFGATELRKALHKFIEMNQGNRPVDFPHDTSSLSKNDSGSHGDDTMIEDKQFPKSSQSERPVKYGVSPAKAAQVERGSSSESEESSYSSEEDQPSTERSRTLIRSASPRRSASPMRRIQIGRSGSRRSTPLTIKSLGYFPARERIVSHKDAAPESSDKEGSEEPSRKSHNNIRRMSVLDAVKLFESKQKEQTVDLQQARSLLNASIGANKSVLRRWSSGMGESSSKHPSDIASDKSDPSGPSTREGGEVAIDSPEAKAECSVTSNDHLAEPLEVNAELNSHRERGSNPDGEQEGDCPTSTVKTSEKLIASAEWSRQKEAELNQLLMKMMETKPVKYQKAAPEFSKKKKVTTEQRGNSYDHYKEKRDIKLRGETAGKRAEKEKHFRAMQQILDERKVAMASKNSSSTGGRENAKNPQRAVKDASQSAKPKTVTSKPAPVKKVSQKALPLPATRKSWSSTPSPRGTGTSPATTPGGMTSAGTTTTRRRSQPPLSAPRLSPKVEGLQLHPEPVKASPGDVKRNSKVVSEKKQQTMANTGKTTKSKVQTASIDPASSAKPSFYSKVTKKSSVVPLESKPFLRKGSGVGSGISPTVRTKLSPQPEGSTRKSGDLIPSKENDIVPSTSGTVIEQLEMDVETSEVHEPTNSELELESSQVREEEETPDQVNASDDESSQRIAESSLKTEVEEETYISPAAWVEIEEQGYQPFPSTDSISHIESPTKLAPVKMSSPRVRHSLSQMLLEESSETDVIEWGNAEHPPSIIYQKDAPKGFKKLLKFARKSKTDASSTGWSSPSVVSEGEDDSEESKVVQKKDAENLLKKATLRAQYDGHQKNSSEIYEENPAAWELSAQANTTKTIAQTLSQKLREGHASASATSTKASRSFFSLSAFKGRK